MKFYKIISLILIESLIFSSASWAAEKNQQIKIPSEFGLIKERHDSENDNLVIHIQDTHTNYSAQHHLAKILEYLNKNYGVDLIGIEGAEGLIDTSAFSSFPDQTTRREVAEYFLKDGKIDGAEYLCIAGDDDNQTSSEFCITGIENPTLYKSNLNAFLRSLPYRNDLIYFCEIMDKNFRKIKQHVYNNLLYEYDNIVSDYHNNKINFIDYCRAVLDYSESNLIDNSSYSALKHLLRLVEIESKINFSQIQSENYLAVRQLSGNLTQSETKNLLQKEFKFKVNKISPEEYYFYLDELFSAHNFSMAEMPNFKKYINYLKEYSSINHDLAFEESELLTRKIYDEIIQTANERKLYELSHYIELINNFIQLKMTRDSVSSYNSYKTKYSIKDIIAYVSRQAKQTKTQVLLNFDSSIIELNLQNFEEFYRIAHQREEVMVSNLIDLMNKKEKKTVIFIAGGFHTQGITNILRQKGVSYLVITPNIANEDNPIPYISLLENVSTPFEQMIATHTSTLKVASWLTQGTPLAYEQRKEVLTAKMKTLFTVTKLHNLYEDAISRYTPQEQVLLRQDIQQQLKDSINEVIRLADYSGVLQIKSVELTDDDIIAEVSFVHGPTSFFVRYTDKKSVPAADKELEKNLLETVQLGDGLTEQFLSSKGYSNISNNYIMLRSRILVSITETPQSMDEILNILNSDKKYPAISKDNLGIYLDLFTQMGLIETDKNSFKISSSELGQLRAYLVNALFSNISVQPAGAAGEIGIINIDNMPDGVRSFFNELNIGTLIAEPTLSLETINRLVDLLVSRNSKSVLSEGAVVALSENAQLNVFKSTDSNKLVVHIMNKSFATSRTGYETVSESIQRKIRLKNYPLISPVDEKSEIVFEIRAVIDEFNAAHSGNFAVVTDTDYITANPKNALNFMLFMTEKFDTAKIKDTKTVKRREIIEKYFLAKEFFRSGDVKQALALIKSIQQQADESALFTDEAVTYNLEYDIERLNEIVTANATYDESELFFALDKIVGQTLNQAEPAFYLPLLLSLGNYLEGNAEPVSGITDVNIYLKTDVFEDEIPDADLRQSFYTEGLTLYKEKLYVNVALFDVTLPENIETLSNMIKSANIARNQSVSRKALSLIVAGLPEDMRLHRFSKSALSPFKPDMYLDDGFATQNISLSAEDFGMEVPVSLNPTIYAKIIQQEQAVFESVLTLVDESARLLRAKKRIQPKHLLMQAQLMVANLKHFSPRFKADLIKAIAADIRNIERTNRNKNPLPPALLLSGRRAGRYSKLKDTRKDALTAKLVKAAFGEIEKVNSELASEIKANMNIVVGYWPGVDMEQSTVPYNAIYIYPQTFERIKFLAGKESTFELAAIQLAKQITDFQSNTRSLNIADFLDEFQLDSEKANEFIEHNQEFITDATENYTGEVVSYLDVKYDKSGRPLFDINGARIVTYFDGGRPVRAWNSSDNKEYYLPIPFEDSEIKGYEVIRDESGNILSLKTPSELEKWIGYLKPGEEIFFLAKDKSVVAIVNPTAEGVKIIPIVPDEKLIELLDVQNVEQAMAVLSGIVEKRNKILIEEGKLWDNPKSEFNPRRRRWNKNRLLAASMLIPIVILNFAGCVSSPIHNPQFPDPYTQTPAIFDRPAITDEDLSAPYDILDFIGTSGDSAVDQQAAQEFTQETIDLLGNLRASLQTELAVLENQANPDTAGIEDLQRRIALLDSTIENLQINAFEAPAVPPSRIPLDGQDLTSEGVDQQLDARRLTHPLPVQLLEITSLMLNNLEYQRTLDSLSEFSNDLTVTQGGFSGLVQSYQPNSDHPDYQYLARYARVDPYDVAVSVFADLSNNDNASANRKVEALLRLIQAEQSAGFNGVVHFNYNTFQDNYIDPRAPLGNTAWTLKAIYAYALVTGDTTVIEGENAQMLQTAMNFVLSQQVMDDTDPRYGLFRAGVHSTQTDGYGVMGSQHVQYEEIITEHLADIHDLLNLAYQVTGDDTYRQRRELMDRRILSVMLVEDAQTAYFVPNINAQGEAGTGVAIDDLTWAGSMVLSMDHLPLERRLEIVGKLINYIDRNFIVEHNGTTGSAQSVELTDELIAARSEVPSNVIVGTKFFDGFFEDEFIERMNWDDPEVMSVQIEATLGYIHLLYQTAAMTPDPAIRQEFINRMVFLMDNIHRFYHRQTEDGGIPYASRSLHGVQTTMESLIASETFRTVMGIWDNPELMWMFIGVPEQSFIDVQTGDAQTEGGVIFDQPQVNTGQEVIRISPNNTYVFDAGSDEQTHIIYPHERVGIEPNEVREFPTLEAQIQEDVANLIQFIEDQLGGRQDYSVELVEDWDGEFLTPPAWTLDALGLTEFATLSPDTSYRATYVDGQFIIATGPRIDFSRLEGVTANQGGDRFNIRIEDNSIVIVPTLSAQEADLYGDYPAAIRRIFYDIDAVPQVFDISQFPEFQNFPAGTTFTAYADQSLANLIVINPANDITVSSDFVVGEDFYAPDNSRFLFEIDSTGTLHVTEQLQLASVYQNPWTPNISPEMLPQFMAGLRQTGHTSLFVDTKPLVNGYEIHGYNPRVYYSTLIELAHREGIEVYAVQGDPNWSTPAGMSIAASYLNTLGNVSVDFDGFVLNVQSQKLPEWESMTEQEKESFITQYSQSIQNLYDIIRTFSDYQRPVLSFVPQELQSTAGYSPVEQTADVLVVNQTSADDILAVVEQFDPSRPFQIMVETSLISDADATFGMREDEMGAILQQAAQALRSNPEYGRFFQGFVINHDSGEDILNVMQTGQGRDISARMEDALLTDIDKPLMVTSNLYEMIISGRRPYVVQAGEERPSTVEILRGTLVSRLEGMLRGFTGAANVDNMVQSVIQTIARDRFTLLPEAIPLGAELGTLMAGANQLWGQQYTDQAVIETITIEGLDADGNVVTVWDDIINNSVPIIVGRDSDIAQFHVNVQINSAEGAVSDFPGYLVFLTHHPDNGGIVTETASDPFLLHPGDSSLVSFTVPVSREGINNYGFMLMHGAKYSESEIVVDRIGFGNRYPLIAQWIDEHADEFSGHYHSAVAESSQMQVNRLGLWSGVLDSRVIINDFEFDELSAENPQFEETLELLGQSGIRELTIDGAKLMEFLPQQDQEGIERFVEFINTLQRNNIRVTLLMGDESWVDNPDAMRENLMPLFTYKLGVNGFVFNFGDRTAEVDPVVYSNFIEANAGYGETVFLDAQDMVQLDNSESLTALLDTQLEQNATDIELSFADFSQMQAVLSGIAQPEQTELVSRANRVDEQSLELFTQTGYDRLSRIEQSLMNFAKVRSIPHIQLGEASSYIEMISPQDIMVSGDQVPYLLLRLNYDGDRTAAVLTGIVQLTNISTGERIMDSFQVSVSQDPQFRSQIINIPIANLPAGQWRYDVTFLPSSYERDRDFVPAMPMTPNGSTVRAGSRQVTVYPMDLDTFQRRIEIDGQEFFIVHREGEQPAVIVNDQTIPLPENLVQGVNFQIGPANMLVNVNINEFNEWAIGTGGEEVVITQFDNQQEGLTVGLPERSSAFGFIQNGLPDIEVEGVNIDIDQPYIDDSSVNVVLIQYGVPIAIGDYTVTLSVDNAGMIVAQTRSPSGEITTQTFPMTSKERIIIAGDKMLLIGTDSINQVVGVISDYSMADLSFEVSNTEDASSSLTYQPEVSFYHPLVGELSISSEDVYTIAVGQTQTITMQVPVPVDFLGEQKLRLSTTFNDLRTIQTDYTDFLREQNRARELGVLTDTEIDSRNTARFLEIKQVLPAQIEGVMDILYEIQQQHMVAEFHLTGIVDLDAEYDALEALLDRLDDVSEEDMPYLLTDIMIRMQSVRIALSDLSTQNYGYRISIHDVSNLLGEEVTSRVSAAGEDVSALDIQTVVREVVVDPVTGRTQQQVVRRIGKAPYAEIVLRVVTPAVVQQRHQTYISQYLDLQQAQIQLSDLVRDYYRLQYFNIPSARLTVDQAQLNIQLASTARDRSRTVDLTSMFFENINRLKIADIQGGRVYILPYAETVYEGEQLIYDTSTEILSLFLSELQHDGSLIERSDARRFLEDIVTLFGLIGNDEITTDEAIVYVNNFLSGADEAQIQRAQNIVRLSMEDERLDNRQRAAFIVSNILQDAETREYLKHLAFSIMSEQLDAQETQAGETFSSPDQTDELEAELDRIRSLRAYMGLVLEHDAAADLLAEAQNNVQLGLDPTPQAAASRIAFQRSLGYFQILIGLETEFQPVTDLQDLITRIEQSDLSTDDKSNALALIQTIRTDMMEFQDFMEERDEALSASESLLEQRQGDLTEAEQLLAHIEEIRAGHQQFIDRVTSQTDEQFLRWQVAVKQVPPEQAAVFTQDVLNMEVENLGSLVRSLDRSYADKAYYESVISTNSELIAQLRQQYETSTSDVDRNVIITGQIAVLQNRSLEASAEVAFLDWHIDFLEGNIETSTSRIVDLQGAILALSGTPDLTVLDDQIAQLNQTRATYRSTESAVSTELDRVRDYRSEVSASYEQLLEQYNYPARMRAVGEQVTISTVLRDIYLINNPESYFSFLSSNGITEVYIDTQEMLAPDGTIDYGRLTYVGRLIQAAHNSDVEVKILITADDQWATSLASTREGMEFVENLAENIRLLQQRLFQYNVYVDGFALQINPHMLSTGNYDMENYQRIREAIAGAVADEYENMLDEIRGLIDEERSSGRSADADRMQTVLDGMLAPDGTIRYDFDVFETELTAGLVQTDLVDRYGQDAQNRRILEYPGTVILIASSPEISALGTEDASLRNFSHGVGFDWSFESAQDRQEQLPALLENILSYSSSENSQIGTIFIDSDSVLSLQRNLNALGEVPIYALDLLQNQENIESIYNSHVLSYVQGLRGQLENLRDILGAEQEFRTSFSGVLDILSDALVLETPDFMLPPEAQLDSLLQRLEELEGQLTLGVSLQEAQSINQEIDELYSDISVHVRRLRVSLNLLAGAGGVEIPGITVLNSTGDFTGLFSGTSSVTLDFGQLLSQTSPIGLSISYRTSDGRQEQRDLLREFDNLRGQIANLRTSALAFSEFSEEVSAFDVQLQSDYTDVAMLRRGIDIASLPEAQTESITFTVDGERITVSGNMLVVLRRLTQIEQQLSGYLQTATRERTALENAAQRLRTIVNEAGEPDINNNFVTQDIELPSSVASIDYALENQQRAELEYRYAYQGRLIAQQEYERSLIGLEDSYNNIRISTENIVANQAAVDDSREDVEQAFIDLLTALTGTAVTRDQLYTTQLGEIGVRIRLDRAEGGLNSAYFNFDTIVSRLIRLSATQSTETIFNEYFAGFAPGTLIPGWELDAIAGPGVPFLGTNQSSSANIAAQLAGDLLQSPASISLYGGVINLSLSYATPNFVNISLNLSSADNSVIGRAETNLLTRQSQFILTEIATGDRQADVQAALDHFESSVTAYNDNLRMLRWHEAGLERANTQLENVIVDLEEARQFVVQSERELELAQDNLEQRRNNLTAARQTVEEIQQSAEDQVTMDEAQGQMAYQPPIIVIDDDLFDDTSITTPDPDMGLEFERYDFINTVLARLLYAFIGIIILIFGAEAVKDEFRKRALKQVEKKKKPKAKDEPPKTPKPVEPDNQKVPSVANETPDVTIDTSEQVDGLSLDDINKIFEEFTPSNTKPLLDYLVYFETHKDMAPSENALNKNRIFRDIQQSFTSPRDVYEKLAVALNGSDLTAINIIQIQDILERIRFVKDINAKDDIILLDLDTFGLSGVENAANELNRKMLIQYMDALSAKYVQNGRTAKFAVFSTKLSSWEAVSVLGSGLAERLEQVYGREMIFMFGAHEQVPYLGFLLTILNNFDLNRANLKIFSNRDSIMDTAQQIGAILADRKTNIFDALRILANLHPQNCAEFKIKGTDLSTIQMINSLGRGYLSLTGLEISMDNEKIVPNRLENIKAQYLIDNAA